MSERPTIADVAARSGVSTATVSRVLSGATPARQVTRDRVLEAARELHYRPSGVARALKRRTTLILGLVVTDIENPFYPQIVRAVEDAAHALGYALLLCNAADDPQRELAYLDLLLERQVDGIIVASSRATRRHAKLLSRAPVPVVLVNSAAPHSGLPAIDADHRLGARLATEHLLRLGHRVIGHVTAPASNAAARPRLAGVRDAVRHEGLPDSALHVALGDGHVGGGEEAARQLLAVKGLTAIACYNDLSAIGVLRAARGAGRRVPDDVSITGFDGIHPAEWTDPPLTTIAQPIGEMSRWAVFHLRDAVDRASRLESAAPGTAPIKMATPVHMQPTLVVRGSTGPPPRGA